MHVPIPKTTPGMCLVTHIPSLWWIWSTDLGMFETMWCGKFKLNLSQGDLPVPVCKTNFILRWRVPIWQGASLHHCKCCNLEGTDQICTNKTGQIRKYRSRLARALGRFWATSVQRLSYLRINATFFCRELALMRSWGARSLCFREPFTRWKYGIDSRPIVLIGSCFWRKLVLKSWLRERGRIIEMSLDDIQSKVGLLEYYVLYVV